MTAWTISEEAGPTARRWTTVLGAFGLLLVLASATHADPVHVKYAGIHPVSSRPVDGMCYIEFPHVHIGEPAHANVAYRVIDGYHYFVGDPVAYGYQGDRHMYYGHHPITVNVIAHVHDERVEYCYIDGPHYHAFPPTQAELFVVKAGAYFYTGPYPATYRRSKPKYIKINSILRRIKYKAPVFVVAPPPQYHGPIVTVRAKRKRPKRRKRRRPRRVAPGVIVELWVPAYDVVEIGMPEIVVVEPRWRYHRHR